jgi:hypothetical protein
MNTKYGDIEHEVSHMIDNYIDTTKYKPISHDTEDIVYYSSEAEFEPQLRSLLRRFESIILLYNSKYNKIDKTIAKEFLKRICETSYSEDLPTFLKYQSSQFIIILKTINR